MTDVKRVIIDAGHGGEEPGVMYDGRRETDDTPRLALAIGRILENNGVDVVYTRTTDVYDTCLLYTSTPCHLYAEAQRRYERIRHAYQYVAVRQGGQEPVCG